MAASTSSGAADGTMLIASNPSPSPAVATASSTTTTTSRKGAAASELLWLLSEKGSQLATVPEEALKHMLVQRGCICNDSNGIHFFSLAVQKFAFDVCSDALRYCRHRKGLGYKKKKNGEESCTLTVEDVASTLNDRGIDILKPSVFLGSAAGNN